jgi:hypothetical protein
MEMILRAQKLINSLLIPSSNARAFLRGYLWQRSEEVLI